MLIDKEKALEAIDAVQDLTDEPDVSYGLDMARGIVDRVKAADTEKIIHALKTQLGTISEYLESESRQEMSPEETIQAIRTYLAEHQYDIEKLEEGESWNY